jgi:hypothetical protein
MNNLTPGQTVTLDGIDTDTGELVVERINLWKNYYNRLKGGAVGWIRHGETAIFMQFTSDKQGVQIQYGKYVGWVTWFFIKELK